MNEYYTCDNCHETYKKELTDEEADREAKELWGVDNAHSRQDFAVVCDDCFQKMHPSKFPELAEKARNEVNP